MKVKLIAKTQGLGELEGKSIGEIMAYAARVSNPNNQNNHSTSGKLLTYCLKHGHVSVFETASLTFEITTSRAIAAQILRHRSFTFQEFSQRYSEVDECEIYEARSQDLKNRQNSIDDMSEEIKGWFIGAQEHIKELGFYMYKEALHRGIAKEQARFLLPLSTQTTLYMTGSIRSWIHYLDRRCGSDVQKEHRDIALDIKKIVIEVVPELEDYFNTVE